VKFVLRTLIASCAWVLIFAAAAFDGAASAQQDRPSPVAPAAPESAQSLPHIEIQGQTDKDIEDRRTSTAAKMVFGREELDRYGDTSIGEVLKRLPGITISGRPGRGGDIRMRGLGHGYTQILINGDPAPRGFSFDTLAPEEVERIEIYRAPIAEHSARAIAGTINIVLREDFQRRQTELRLTATQEHGFVQPSVSLQRSDSDERFGYNVAVNVFGKNQGSELDTITTAIDRATGRTTLLQEESDQVRTHGEGVHLSSRLNWRLEGGDQLNLTPFLMQSRSPAPDVSTLSQPIGSTPAPFASAEWVNETQNTVARLGGDWQHRFTGGTKLRLRFLVGTADNDSTRQQDDVDAGGDLAHSLFNATSIQDRTVSTGGKFSIPLQKEGEYSTGWDLEDIHRAENASTVQDGVLQLAQFGTQIGARIDRAAAFVQRDWNLEKNWSAYAGARWEGIATTSEDAGQSTRNVSSVLSPILQSLWRLGDEEKEERQDQVRLSLARTYRAPSLNNLVARPSVSTLYPVSGPNAPTSPDSVGNPQLKPELAWGFDAAYERYLGQGGILSASAFHRSIENLMRSSTNLENVSYSPVARWVTETQNVGHAQTSGIELEAKFRLAEWVPDAPPVDLRANWSIFRSSVSGIVGPYNRLDQQPRQTANFGLDQHLRSVPLTVGFNYNITPAFLVQQADNQVYSQGIKRVLDCYGLWVFDRKTRLRISLFNAQHLDYDTGNEVITDTTIQTADAAAKTYLAISARLEIKL
jgi:outer membrane receptor for ferrienterochelin and colicins